MSLRPSPRLPPRFNRPVTNEMRTFVARRHARKRQERLKRWKRLLRRTAQLVNSFERTFVRWLIVGLAAVLLLGIGFVLFSPIVEVREVRVRRTDPRLDSEKVQHALTPLFGRHLLFLSAQEVAQLLRKPVPDLSEVRVRKEYPDRLILHIGLEPLIAQLRIEPDAGALQGSVQSSSGAYLTVMGRYVQSPAHISPSLPLVTVVDWSVRPVPGDPLISPDFLSLLETAEKALEEEFGQEVRTRLVYLRAREFHLGLDRFSLWFDRKSPLEDHLARYRIFLTSVPLGELKEYVDLRLSDRVAYR